MTLIVTWLWQGLAIACITVLALKATPRLNAATRHVIWWLALAAVLAIPVVHFAAPHADTPSMPEVMKSASVGAVMLVLPALPRTVTTGLIAFWAFTLVFGLIRIARSCREVGRLKRTSVLFDRAREARLTMWVSARDSSRRRMGLRMSESRAGACALGLGGPPIILVSGSLVEALTDDELDEIVMHEQAHLERRDDWLRLLQAIASSIAGLHPAMRFILRQIDADCEAACDDRVVARTGDARRYAWTLAAAASAAVERDELGLTPAATGTAAALRRRVNRLLDPRRDRGPRLAWGASLTSAAVLAIAVAVAPQLTPIVAFGEAADTMLPIPASRGASISLAAEPASGQVFATVVAESPATTRPKPTTRPIVRRTSVETTPRVRTVQIEPLSPLVGVERAVPDTPRALPADFLSSRTIGNEASALVLVGKLPVPSISNRSRVETDGVSPWSELATSATTAAIEAARAATATGTRAGTIGASFGNLATRVSIAVASQF
jgi:beta-lactamase regulating signal transducer with metallopeptidase domain